MQRSRLCSGKLGRAASNEESVGGGHVGAAALSLSSHDGQRHGHTHFVFQPFGTGTTARCNVFTCFFSPSWPTTSPPSLCRPPCLSCLISTPSRVNRLSAQLDPPSFLPLSFPVSLPPASRFTPPPPVYGDEPEETRQGGRSNWPLGFRASA